MSNKETQHNTSPQKYDATEIETSIRSPNEEHIKPVTFGDNAHPEKDMETMQELRGANAVKIKAKKETMPKPSIRFDGVAHWSKFDDPEEGRKGFKCKKEGCGQSTPVFCEKCNVHLCFVVGKNGRNCFRSFHILEES